MIDATVLLTDTKRLVVSLIDDLRRVAASDTAARDHVTAEYQRAHAAGRTAFGQAEWAEGLYAQVAVAWTLGCVFVRFCEDNDLIAEPLLGGPGIRASLALDQRAAHLHANPSHDDRHWLRDVFTRLRSLPATGEVFGAHNLVWAEGLLPSADGARRLREELARIDPETGDLRHNFTDDAWDTRFLGDLYQDLSEQAKKTFALLQTPVFVEEFILDRTLEPAIATFGLADATIIDPTCGSGHFLLGAFDRLVRRRIDVEPSANRRVLAQRALDAIGGVDLNPFAVSITRFRLLLAALRAGGDVRLGDAPAYDLNIAVGDSLLHGDPPGSLPGMHVPGEEEALLANHGYEAEDVAAVRGLLGRGWTAVVGNPPYITVKDSALNKAYRARFTTCHRQYSLGVPFTQRFWQLAAADGDRSRAGYIGMITANSFMKREFGKKLIEQWVPRHDVTHVIDTSGAYIPGHGTPTVILFGRNRAPVEATVRAVMGIRSEPSRPAEPEEGLVWSSIVDLVDAPGSQSDYVSVVDLERDRLHVHPWSIGGGGAAELKELLDRRAKCTLQARVVDVGFVAVTREDDVFRVGAGPAKRAGIGTEFLRPMIVGEEVRDWAIHGRTDALWPYELESFQARGDVSLERFLWPWRTQLSERVAFGKRQVDRGLEWWEYSMLFANRLREPLTIVYPTVSTHSHFSLDRGGRVFKDSVIAIKLPAGAEESSHLHLLGALNSSAGCFWLKQVSHDKGSQGVNEGAKAEKWERFFVYDGSKLLLFPVPEGGEQPSAAELDALGSELVELIPSTISPSHAVSGAQLDEARRRHRELRARMVAAQEQLDWRVYSLFGLVQEDVTSGPASEPPLELGERAFEIALARRIAAGDDQSTWFSRHGSTPQTALPDEWPEWYQRLVERRVELIETDLNVALLERPEYKRRWLERPWDEQIKSALRGWLLDRLEGRRYWPDAAGLTTVGRLAAEARVDADFLEVARRYTDRNDVDIASVIAELVKSEAVPYLAALRYSDSGLRKRSLWMEAWQLQLRQDAGEDVGNIPVPPKYGKPDFAGAGWEHRGRLDVPKERFISYPGAQRETDVSDVVGWAGWDHLARARALAAWYLQAKRDGRDRTHLTPLLAGLAELVPWLKQWYDEPDTDAMLDRPGSQIAALVETELRSLSLTHDDLIAWRPASKKSGRPRKAAG